MLKAAVYKTVVYQTRYNYVWKRNVAKAEQNLLERKQMRMSRWVIGRGLRRSGMNK